MRFFVSEAEIIHRDSLQLKWQPSRRVKFDLLYLLAMTNKVSWEYLCILSMNIHICKLKTYTQLDDQPLILSSNMSCQRSMAGFLDLSSFVSARTQQMGEYQKLYSNRTALMFRVLGVAWNNQFRSSWSCHPTARSGERQDNTMIMAYADSWYI